MGAEPERENWSGNEWSDLGVATWMPSDRASGILTPCHYSIYHAYRCIYMFEVMHVAIYQAYRCIYTQRFITFQGDFPMFEHSRILVPWHYIVIWRQNWKNCMLILDLCPLCAYLYIPCTSWYIPCFHIGKDKSVISCCRVVHWCLIMPAYILHAQHSLSCSQKWQKHVCRK